MPCYRHTSTTDEFLWSHGPSWLDNPIAAAGVFGFAELTWLRRVTISRGGLLSQHYTCPRMEHL